MDNTHGQSRGGRVGNPSPLFLSFPFFLRISEWIVVFPVCYGIEGFDILSDVFPLLFPSHPLHLPVEIGADIPHHGDGINIHGIPGTPLPLLSYTVAPRARGKQFHTFPTDIACPTGVGRTAPCPSFGFLVEMYG